MAEDRIRDEAQRARRAASGLLGLLGGAPRSSAPPAKAEGPRERAAPSPPTREANEDGWSAFLGFQDDAPAPPRVAPAPPRPAPAPPVASGPESVAGAFDSFDWD